MLEKCLFYPYGLIQVLVKKPAKGISDEDQKLPLSSFHNPHLPHLLSLFMHIDQTAIPKLRVES